MTVASAYEMAVQSRHIVLNSAQYPVIVALEQISQQLILKHRQQQMIWWRLTQPFRTPRLVSGIYLWGDVGSGKTYLLDLFYNELPFSQKLRQHFHEFMQEIHQQLARYQGVKNPLALIAKRIAANYLVLCLDEFFVNDIGDAMVLGNLLTALCRRGVTIVTTSNIEPDKLYYHGLQRELFLPAIAALKHYLTIIHLVTHQDFRQTELTLLDGYFSPLSEAVAAKMRAIFMALAPGQEAENTIQINQRIIKTIAWSGQVAWFDFYELCQTPRSQYDYLAIAERFQYILLSNVPQIQPHEQHLITYFIYLIDILYDRKITLFISAAVPIHELYPQGNKAFDFQRTQSRLQQMQTKSYIGASIINKAIE